MKLLALVLVAGVGTAHANARISVVDDPEQVPRIAFRGVERVALDNVSIALRSRIDGGAKAHLTFRLTTRDRDVREGTVKLALSHGTAITGFRYSIGGEAAIEASRVDASDAFQSYRDVVDNWGEDPALLRWTSDTGDGLDVYEISVFPITRGMPALVTIDVEVPPAPALVFDPGPLRLTRIATKLDGKASRWRDVTSPRKLPLPAGERPSVWADAALVRPAVAVDPATSLLADDRGQPSELVVEHHHVKLELVMQRDPRIELRGLIRDHAQALEHCYALGRERSPMLPADVMATVRIDDDGDVTRTTISGDMNDTETRECISDEIATWKLSAARGRSRTVRQALDLRDLD